MENIAPTITNYQSPHDLVVQKAFGLVFKEVLSSLVSENDDLKDAFRTDEDKETESELTSNFQGYSEEFANSFLKSTQGQQILNQVYKQYSAPADNNSKEIENKEKE